jgi:hypothetical protein
VENLGALVKVEVEIRERGWIHILRTRTDNSIVFWKDQHTIRLDKAMKLNHKTNTQIDNTATCPCSGAGRCSTSTRSLNSILSVIE